MRTAPYRYEEWVWKQISLLLALLLVFLKAGHFSPRFQEIGARPHGGIYRKFSKFAFFENFATAEKDLLDKAKSHDYTFVDEIFGTCKPVWHIASMLWVPSRAS